MTNTAQAFGTIKNIVETRRTLKPEAMNGKLIPDEQMHELLALADWAPTHGRTEPWRFYVYTGENLKQFCYTHAEMYKAHATEETYKQETYENLLHKGDLASHMIIAAMKRGANPKIPAVEELASAAASVQNVLLGATALGISTMWNTGGMAHKNALKEHLGLGDEDTVLGLIYFGYSDEPAKEGKRVTPLSDKLISGI